MVCGPNEADRYLKGSLDEFKRLVDDAVIVGNNTDPKTEAMIKSYGYWFYRDDREWGIHQPHIKTDLLKRIGQLKPDIVVAIDADEVFDPLFDRPALDGYCAKHVGCYVYVVNMWNDTGHHRKSMGFWNIRAFQFRSDLGLEYQKQSLHCGLGPPWAYKHGANIPVFLKHYGLMKPEDRAKKVKRYEQYDPKARFKDRAYYEALKYEGNGAVFDEQEFRQKLVAEVSTYGGQNKTISMALEKRDFVYVKRLIDGRVLDMTAQEWADMDSVRKKGFEFVEPINLDAAPNLPEAPKVEDVIQCPICGKDFKSKAGLAKHKASH